MRLAFSTVSAMARLMRQSYGFRMSDLQKTVHELCMNNRPMSGALGAGMPLPIYLSDNEYIGGRLKRSSPTSRHILSIIWGWGGTPRRLA